MGRVNITIPDNLLLQVDEMATKDYTTRSDIIRQAVLFYMRSTASTLNKTEVESLFKNMKNRQLKAYLNNITKKCL